MAQEVKPSRPDTSLPAIAKSFSVRPGTALSPFICSTVDDFKNEHRILHEKVFPQLSELCLLRKMHFSPVDLGRDRSLKSQENSLGMLCLSLDYVTKCAPFFLCLLGERYGAFRDPTHPQLSSSSMHLDVDEDGVENRSWLDKNLRFAASSGYKWLLDDTHQYYSRTELTIRHAVFSTDDSPASEATQHFSFFYFRQPDHLELLESSLQHLSSDERNKKLAIYKSESEFAASCVEELKLNIVKKGLSVRYFGTAEQLATFTLDDWKSVIDFLYPPLDSRTISFEWFSEEIELNLFSTTRRELFVHTSSSDAILRKLTDFALDRIVNFKSSGISSTKTALARKILTSFYNTGTASEKIHDEGQGREESLFLLVGSRGCGKSSLLSTWADSFRRSSPPVIIFEHYVDCTENSTNVVAMMRRCIAHLRSTKHYMPGTDYGLNMEDLDEYKTIREEFHAVIRSEGCVLVVDNIDELCRRSDTSDQMVKDLNWLPFPLPPTITVIASCTKTDAAYRSLSDRSDVRVVSLPSVDDINSRRAMLTKSTELNGKMLDRGDWELVIGGSLADRPLYLALVGGEMRAFVASERMLSCLRCCNEAPSICDLWGHIVRRWTDEYSWDVDGQANSEHSGWIPDTLRLISTSRDGLLQSELLAILSELGFTGPRTISAFDWQRFRLAASNVLVQTSAGLIRFMHNHVKEATDFVLFGCVTPFCGYRKAERTPLKDSGSETRECRLPSKRIYHRHIANYFVKRPFGTRQADELPWQFSKIQDYEMLAELLSDHKIFLEMYGKGSKSHRASEILGYWKTLLKAGFNAGAMYQDELGKIYSEYLAVKHTILLDPKMKPSAFTQQYCKLCICVGELLMLLGCHGDAREALMHGIHHLNKVMPLSKSQLILLSRLQAFVGNVFARCEDGHEQSEAVKWYEQSAATIEGLLNNVLWNNQRRNLLEAKGCLLVCLGNARTEEGNLVAAEALLNSARRCMLQTKSIVGKALVAYSVGLLQMLQKDFDQSEESLRSALHVLKSYHGKSHPNVARIYSELGTLAANTENSEGFDVSKAEGFYRTAIKLNEECFGSCHVLVANDLFSLGILLWCNGNDSQKDEAHEMVKRASDICMLKLGADHSMTRKIRDVLTGQEVESATLQLQALDENATLVQRKSFPPNTGKSKVRCKHKTPLCKTSAKQTQLPVIDSFSEDGLQPSVLEVSEVFEVDSETTPPKQVGFVPPIPRSRHSKDDNSMSVANSRDLDDKTCYIAEKIIRWSARNHHMYRATDAARMQKSPVVCTRCKEIKNCDSRQKHCTSPGTHRHISCFDYNENVPRSIMSGPCSAINSLLNKKQFSLPTPGSLH